MQKHAAGSCAQTCACLPFPALPSATVLDQLSSRSQQLARGDVTRPSSCIQTLSWAAQQSENSKFCADYSSRGNITKLTLLNTQPTPELATKQKQVNSCRLFYSGAHNQTQVLDTELTLACTTKQNSFETSKLFYSRAHNQRMLSLMHRLFSSQKLTIYLS